MNKVEAAIYGTVFAQSYTHALLTVPAELTVPGKEQQWGEWEQEQTSSACEAAADAVEAFRAIRPQLADGYEGTHVLVWYDEARLDD